jgi:hypothetical protein
MWITALMHYFQSSGYPTRNGQVSVFVRASVHSTGILITRAFCFPLHTEMPVFTSLLSTLPSDTIHQWEGLAVDMTAVCSLTFIY